MLEQLLDSRNVYFQPPESVKMKYPASRYSLNSIDNSHADNKIYIQNRSYTVMVLDKESDSIIADEISMLPKCKMVQKPYCVDGIWHFVFTLYY